MTEEMHLYCLRCETELKFAGRKQFHEGYNWGVIGDIGEFLVDKVCFEMYVCPECGHVELFADRIGKEPRPHLTLGEFAPTSAPARSCP